ILFERFADDAIEFDREGGIQASRRGGLLVQDGIEDGGGGVAGEGQQAGGHFVENCTKGKEIAAGVEFFAKSLIRRHVGEGAEKQVQLERTAGNALAERLALEKLHSDEGAMIVLADFIDGADVGMVEGGSGAGFALEALEGLAIVGEGFGKKLQSDVAA